jgi:Multidrug resistance efflux pump
VEQARQQLVQSEKSLEQARSGGDVTLTGTGGQISSATSALATAETQLQITRRQNELSIQQAQAAVDSARNSVQRAQTQFGKLTVTAPVAGVVTEVMVEAGDTVSIGAPLVVIAQTDALVLRGDVRVEVLPALRPGMSVDVEIDGFGAREGSLSKIFPVADAATRRVTIEVAVGNPGRTISANIYATAELALPAETGIIMLPFKALASQQPASVFVIGPGRERKRPPLDGGETPDRDWAQRGRPDRG